MTTISESFASTVKNIEIDTAPPESYLGVLVHKYRLKHNLSMAHLACLWGLDEKDILKLEMGFASPDEVGFIFSEISSKEKRACNGWQAL
jgi:hypothetical protein